MRSGKLELWVTLTTVRAGHVRMSAGGGTAVTCELYFGHVSTKTVTGQTFVVSKVLPLHSSDDEGVKGAPALYQKIVVALQQQGPPVPPGICNRNQSKLQL